jgi:aconitate hydratase
MRHQQSGSLIVAGRNYGQGASYEHGAIAPRYLGVTAVIAKGIDN